ncbi:MAG: hypothetical protein IE922_12715 [Sphingomonadales bacterium]|nr:hypothetical protein [Sphingomonadales bacterium]
MIGLGAGPFRGSGGPKVTANADGTISVRATGLVAVRYSGDAGATWITGTVTGDAAELPTSAGQSVIVQVTTESGLVTLGEGGGTPDPELPVVTTWAGMAALNDTELAAAPMHVLSRGVTAWGDSLTESLQVTAPERWVALMSDHLSGQPINNRGVSGETAPQIGARVAVAPAGELDDVSLIMAGTNNLLSSPDQDSQQGYADVITTAIDEMVSHIVGPVCISQPPRPYVRPQGGGAYAEKRVEEALRASYGDNYVDPEEWLVRAVASPGATDLAQMKQGVYPSSMTADGLHWNAAGNAVLAANYTRIAAALDGGAPFVIDDEGIAVPAGAGPGTVLHRMRRMGTPTRWDIVGGNADGVVSVNAAGELIWQGVAMTDAYREVFVMASNASGRHVGRAVLYRLSDGFEWVRADAPLGQILHSNGFPNKRRFTVVMNVGRLSTDRVDLIRIGGRVFYNTAQGFIIKSAGGTNIAVRNDTPPVGSSRWIGLSIDLDAGLFYSLSNNTASSRALSSTADIGFSPTEFTFGATGYPNALDVRALWVANDYIDLTSPAVRGQMFNAANFDPVFAAGGVVAGVTPKVFMHGAPGDWQLGRNRGSLADAEMRKWWTPEVAGWKGI